MAEKIKAAVAILATMPGQSEERNHGGSKRSVIEDRIKRSVIEDRIRVRLEEFERDARPSEENGLS